MPLRGAVFPHMIPGLHAIGVHKKAAIAARLKLLTDQFAELFIVINGLFSRKVVGTPLENT